MTADHPQFSLLQRLADRQPVAVEQVAVAGIEIQGQRLAITRREIAADAHRQRLAGLGNHVAIGVAAQSLADIGLDGQLAIARAAAVEVLRTNAQRNRVAHCQ